MSHTHHPQTFTCSQSFLHTHTQILIYTPLHSQTQFQTCHKPTQSHRYAYTLSLTYTCVRSHTCPALLGLSPASVGRVPLTLLKVERAEIPLLTSPLPHHCTALSILPSYKGTMVAGDVHQLHARSCSYSAHEACNCWDTWELSGQCSLVSNQPSALSFKRSHPCKK